MTDMALSDAERARRYRARLRGGEPRPLEPCGTWAAAKRHERNGEPLDDACRQARDDHNAEQYAKRKAKRKAKRAAEQKPTRPKK